MRKNLMTGLAILLPIVITYLLVMFFVHLLTNPFLGMVQFAFHKFGWVGAPHLLKFLSQVLILVVLFSATLFVGFIGRLFLITVLFNLGDKLVHKIPFVNKLYKAIQDVVHSVFTSDTPSFSQVVLIPFPNSGSYSLGFITRESLPEVSQAKHHLISVFVPGTPNPSMGFMLTFTREQIIPLDMDVQKALKFIVSCGVIYEA